MLNLFREHLERVIPLADQEFESICAFFTVKKLKKRQFLLQQGDLCKYESFVLSGCLKSYYTDTEGLDHILRFSIEGWWAGDLKSFVRGQPSTFNIEAIEPVVLFVIDKPRLDTLYLEIPKFARFFQVLNENALIATSQRVIDILSLPSKERYQYFLTTYPILAARIPLKDIASYLGITPVFLSQIRKELAGKC